MSWKPVRYVSNLAAGLLWTGFVIYLVFGKDHLGWDFRVYYQAVQQFLDSKDPFAEGQPVWVGHLHVLLPFVYPPLTLAVLAPLVLLSVSNAYFVWLALKLIGVGVLWRLWNRRLGVPYEGWVGLLLLLGFNSSLATELMTGNFALFEALLLTIAMFALTDRKYPIFVALVCVAAAFKVAPVCLLVLGPVFGGKQAVRSTVYGVFGLLLYAALNIALWPKMTAEFLLAAASRDESQSNNPSLLEFCRDLAGRIPYLPFKLVYVLLVGAILYRTWRVIQTSPENRQNLVLLSWLGVALVLPRLMVYSFVPFIPMACLALKQLRGKELALVATLLCFQLPESYLFQALPSVGPMIRTALAMKPELYSYLSLYALFAVWWFFGRSLSKLDAVVPSAGGSSALAEVTPI